MRKGHQQIIDKVCKWEDKKKTKFTDKKIKPPLSVPQKEGG